MPSGRPTKKTQAIIDEIIRSISEGVTLRDICRRDGMPNYRTIYDWLDGDKDFSARFAKARDAGYDQIADECVAIADDSKNDYSEKDGAIRLNPENVQRAKLRVWTRLQLLSKWSNKYSEKYRQEITGKDGGPIETKFEVVFVENRKICEK